jgi:anaerobic selenocysteine-containing dehydrogenase
MAVRAITMLPCITGSWKEVGGGLQLSLSGAFAPLRREALELENLDANNGKTRTINMVELGRVLNGPLNPPVKALFVYNSNPAAVAPDHNNVVRGLMQPDLFTVAHEQFLTDTCDYADIVLPATTFFEHKDLQPSYGHYWLQISQKAIEPLGECRSNVELFRALAERMGFTDPCFRDSVDDMIDAALDTKHPWLDGITRERLEREGCFSPNFQKSEAATQEFFLPFANGFQTPSGKAELYSEAMARQGLDPVATFIPPAESRQAQSKTKACGGPGEDALAGAKARYPLEFLPRKADNWLNSTFCNLPSHQALEEGNVLDITQADASVRGIADGDDVCVFNDRGEVRLKARVNGRVPPGVVAAKLGWAKLSESRQSVNALTSQRLSDMGGGPTFYSTLVEVKKA